MTAIKISLQKLIRLLRAIKGEGFIISKRIHDTGIGHTLEQALGLKENNMAIPDLGTFELKAQRYKSSSLITFFTKKPDDILNSKILDKFGYPRKDGKLVIHQTIRYGAVNAKGFRMVNQGNDLIIYKDNNYIFSYNKSGVKKSFDKKFSKGVVLVLADSKKNGREKFHFREAYLMKSGNFKSFINHLFYDIRIGRYPNGKPHDHGSAFRIRKIDLPKLFKIYRKLI